MGYWESIGCTISNPAAIVESYFKYKSIEITHNILDYSLSTYLEYLHSSLARAHETKVAHQAFCPKKQGFSVHIL